MKSIRKLQAYWGGENISHNRQALRKKCEVTGCKTKIKENEQYCRECADFIQDAYRKMR